MNLELKIKAIHKLRPNTEWALDEHTGLSFKDKSIVVPTEAEINATVEQIKADEITETAAKATAKAALLAQLGITEEQAKLLLS
jgi:hypothetical protein